MHAAPGKNRRCCIQQLTLLDVRGAQLKDQTLRRLRLTEGQCQTALALTSTGFSTDESKMRRAVPGLVLVGTVALGGCSQGVLDPQGPIAAAERLLLINSTAIMLVVVIPVIVATLAFAWW